MTTRAHRFPNTHLLVPTFAYLRPGSLTEALAAMQTVPEARLLAGGTNLLVDMKLERCSPDLLVDISQLAELHGIESLDGGDVRIGALSSMREIALHQGLWRGHTCLAEAAAAFGSTQIMMRGTLGGNIANGSPASDTVPALVVLGAQAMVGGRRGQRAVLVADLLDKPGSIALNPGEILTDVRIPASPPHTGSCFLKLSRVRADLAKVSVAVRLIRRGDRIEGSRIALGSVGPTVLRARKASSLLLGRVFSEELVLEAAHAAAEEILPIDDVRSSADYRRRAAAALVHDALLTAWQRAGEECTFDARGVPPQPVLRAPGSSPTVQLAEDEMMCIEWTLNGECVQIDVACNELLLNVLRDRFQLTGTKYGCGIGECGACTVWMDGVPVLACLVLAASTDGAEIRTVEGLAAPDGTLDPVQQAFIDENAFQCGYCTPAMLMMTRKLLDEIPQPTECEVRDYLKGNHCRCTGYASIVRAVDRASLQQGGGS